MDALKNKRKMLDGVTVLLVDLICVREEIAREVGEIKKERKIPIVNLEREAEVIAKARAYAKKRGVDELLVERIMKLLMEDAKKLEKRA